MQTMQMIMIKMTTNLTAIMMMIKTNPNNANNADDND